MHKKCKVMAYYIILYLAGLFCIFLPGFLHNEQAQWWKLLYILFVKRLIWYIHTKPLLRSDVNSLCKHIVSLSQLSMNKAAFIGSLSLVLALQWFLVQNRGGYMLTPAQQLPLCKTGTRATLMGINQSDGLWAEKMESGYYSRGDRWVYSHRLEPPHFLFPLINGRK